MSSKGQGILATILFHLALLVVLMLGGFSTPLPLPAEEGILINFGNSNNGSGHKEPSVNIPSSRPQPATPPSPKTNQSPITQDIEEAPALPIPPKKKEVKENPKPVEKPQEKANVEEPKEKQVEPTPEPEPEPKPQPKVNKKALFPGKDPNGGNSGEGETGKPGNQGAPDGSISSSSHSGSTGGNGDGEREIIANLVGRDIRELPLPNYPKKNAQGKVVVSVKVDKDGNVTEAIGGQRGSSTFDYELVKAAEKAALKAKFSPKPDVTFHQVGTITYTFKNN